MLPEALLVAIHTERLSRRVPLPLFNMTLRRVANVPLAVMLDAERGETFLAALQALRLRSRDRSRAGPSWRCVATVYAAAERTHGLDPEAADRWLEQRFGQVATGLDTTTLCRAIAHLRRERATHTQPAGASLGC